MTSMQYMWKRRLLLVPCLLASLSGAGCGPAPDPTVPPPIKDEDKSKIAALLPPGVTLESPIEADPMLGPNSKTVGEALTALHAYVKDGKIYNGGMSSVIQFKTSKDSGKGPKAARGKAKEDVTTIVVSGG
jgi:hypothetical protein